MGEGPPNILIVDDEAANLLVLESVLRPLGARLFRASSGDEALKHLLDNEFAVILMDVKMPGMGGIETATLIRRRERTRHTPLMFLTAASDDTHSAQAYRLGAVDFIYKPFAPESLTAKVAVFIELDRKTQQLRRQAESIVRLKEKEHEGKLQELKHLWEAQRLRELVEHERRLAETVRQNEEDRIKLTEELRQSNLQLDQFVSVASHDLQEPLRTVSSYLTLLSRRCADRLDAQGRDYLELTVDAATRMQRLIQSLLTYARSGTRKVELEPVDLEALLQDVMGDLEASVRETGAEITHSLLPRIRGDREQLAQVLRNLLANALKFHDASAPHVRIAAEKEGDLWHFTVADRGIGLDMRHAQRIFEPFQRLHAEKDYQGSGIGLAVCKRIIEQHGGRIWVESESGQGTTFHFTIPANEQR